MAKAYLAVRAEVPEADRTQFDHWYETDHLPWALRVFGARRAWRCWSRSDAPDGSGVHVAFYEFDSVEAAEAIQRSDAIRPLVDDFDRMWQGRVTRRRAVLDVVQEIEAG
jgi:hypothetical protein